MNAAIIEHQGQVPHYGSFPDPIATKEEILIQVKAVALENVDKALASGRHYAANAANAANAALPDFPAVVGLKGIGRDPEGKLVGFGGVRAPYGSLAELAVVPRGYAVVIPEGLDPVAAAAMPAAALTSYLPLRISAKLQPGETVLVQGGTGVSGKLAVQLAKILGAGRVVVTGRNLRSLQEALDLGADATIELTHSDTELARDFVEKAGTGYDVILDFLWGHPTEVLFEALIPRSFAFGRSVRLVQIGEMAGESLSLKASSIRNSGVSVIGAGAGLTREWMASCSTEIYKLMLDKKLKMDIEVVALKDIEKAWQRSDLAGKRIVIVP